MSLNRVALVGRLVRDPEHRTTSTGKTVVDFSLAVDRRLKPTDPDAPTADFLRAKAWGQQGDYLVSYGAKGRLLAVDGRLETRRYTDKDGNGREVVEVVADHVSLLDRQPEEGSGGPLKSGDQKAAGYSSGPTPGGGYASRRPSGPATRGNAAADERDPFADEQGKLIP